MDLDSQPNQQFICSDWSWCLFLGLLERCCHFGLVMANRAVAAAALRCLLRSKVMSQRRFFKSASKAPLKKPSNISFLTSSTRLGSRSCGMLHLQQLQSVPTPGPNWSSISWMLGAIDDHAEPMINQNHPPTIVDRSHSQASLIGDCYALTTPCFQLLLQWATSWLLPLLLGVGYTIMVTGSIGLYIWS